MKKVLVFLLMIGVGAFLGWAGTKLLIGEKAPDSVPLLPDGYGIWLLLCLPLLYLLVIGFHELGHVIAGSWQRFQFYGLTVGPLAWKPDDNGKTRFHWNKSLNLAGGVAIMLPEGADDLRRRFMWFAAGGPLASLLLAAAAYGLSQLVAPPNFFYFLFLTTTFFSLVIFIATILPFRAGGFASDGLRILTFARNGPTAAADLAGLRAAAHLRSGQPHADLPVKEFEAVATNDKVPAQQRATMDYYRYLHALAKGKIDDAADLYAAVMARLEAYPAGTHGNFHLEQAFFEAHYRRNLPAAEAALARNTPGPFTEALSVNLAEAAIASLRQDHEALTTLLPEIEAALPNSMDQSRVPQIKEWLKSWNDLVATS